MIEIESQPAASSDGMINKQIWNDSPSPPFESAERELLKSKAPRLVVIITVPAIVPLQNFGQPLRPHLTTTSLIITILTPTPHFTIFLRCHISLHTLSKFYYFHFDLNISHNLIIFNSVPSRGIPLKQFTLRGKCEASTRGRLEWLPTWVKEIIQRLLRKTQKCKMYFSSLRSNTNPN